MKRSKNLAIVERQETPIDHDTPERFALRTRHLRTGSGQPLESTLFKLAAEKAAQS